MTVMFHSQRLNHTAMAAA